MSVDTARLRELLVKHRDAIAAEKAITDAVVDFAGMTADGIADHIAAVTTAAADVDTASGAFARAVHRDLPALLDELDAARKLLREVAEHGLADFDPTHARIDLTRRVAAFVGE